MKRIVGVMMLFGALTACSHTTSFRRRGPVACIQHDTNRMFGISVYNGEKLADGGLCPVEPQK